MSVRSLSDVCPARVRSLRHAVLPILALATFGVVTTVVRVPVGLDTAARPAPAPVSGVRAEKAPVAAPALVTRIPGRSVRGFDSMQIVKDKEKPFNGFIAAAAKEHRIDPALIRAVIHAESNFAPRARSRVGAQGLMQLMPATAAEVGLRRRKLLHDPRSNIFAGTAYLSKLADRFGPTNSDLIIAAYNAGPGAVQKWGGIPPYAETQGYVKKVMKFWGGEKKAGGTTAVVAVPG